MLRSTAKTYSSKAGLIEKTYVSTRCSKCNASRVVPFLRIELLELLSTGRPINCACAKCGEIWPITKAERAALQRELA